MAEKEIEMKNIPFVSFLFALLFLLVPVLAMPSNQVVASGEALPNPEIVVHVSKSLDGTRKAIESFPYVRSVYLEFGILIPNKVMPEYSGVEGPNSLLTPGEIRVLGEALRMIPNVGELIQLIIPVRSNDPLAIPGGSYLDYQWPFFLNPRNYEEFPMSYFLSDQRAVLLKLPLGKEVSDPLPEITAESTLLTPLLQLTYQGFELRQDMEIPWSTYGEKLKQAIIHEIGHAVLSQASLNDSKSIQQFWNRQGFTLYGLNSIDINNPLFVEFASVNGWRLITLSEYLENLSRGTSSSSNGDLLIWDRDPVVWGSISEREIRISPYASYGPIQEAFSEFWMASILYPDLLSEQELSFFSSIFHLLESGSRK